MTRLDLSRIAITLPLKKVSAANGCAVRVISRSMLREFWESRTHDAATAERDLNAWYKLAEKADWENFAALKRTFGTADQVGNCVVFDVGNNRYRLIGRVMYASGRLYVLKVMDHHEYDRKDPKNKRQQKWVDECGCNDPPPKWPAARQPRGGK